MFMKKKYLLNDIKTIVESNTIKIIEESKNKQIFFEIGTEITSDIGEAVALMMVLNEDIDSFVWLRTFNIDIELIDPRKSLYWLSGGDIEWITLLNYKLPWSECYTIFEKEFSEKLLNILKTATTLKSIKDGFNKEINIFKVYECALRNGLVK